MALLVVIWSLLPLGCTGGDSSDPKESAALDDTGAPEGDDTGGGETADTHEPATGEQLFATWCASCHGASGEGSYSGPGLEREVQAHSDEEIRTVILEGRGDMSAVPVTADEATLIVGWLRELFPSS